MLYTIIAILALTAILGMILITHVLKSQPAPRGVMLAHGLLAATGIVLLLVYTFKNRPGPVESAVLFVIAALGGFLMAYKELTGKPVPKWLAVLHGLLAVTGFIILLVFTFGL